MKVWIAAAAALSFASLATAAAASSSARVPARAAPAQGDDEARFHALFARWKQDRRLRVADPAPNRPPRPLARSAPPRAAAVTSDMGMRVNPVLGRRMFHAGADLRASTGTVVRATADGLVAKAGRAGGYGLLVSVHHSDGYETRYAHLSRILVAPGGRVQKGQAIGEVGSTGRSTGAHLHYEVRRHGRPMNPLAFMGPGAG